MNIILAGGKKHLRLIGTILAALLLLLVFLLIPRQDSYEKALALYDKGEYSLCAQFITDELKKDRHWHLGRDLLVKTYLALEQSSSALEHYLTLVRAGQGEQYHSLFRSLADAPKWDFGQWEEILQREINQDPKELMARTLLFRLYLGAGRLQQALDQLGQAADLGLDTKDMEALFTAGLGQAAGPVQEEILGNLRSLVPGSHLGQRWLETFQVDLLLVLMRPAELLEILVEREGQGKSIPGSTLDHIWLLVSQDIDMAVEMMVLTQREDYLDSFLKKGNFYLDPSALAPHLARLQELWPENMGLIIYQGLLTGGSRGLELLIALEVTQPAMLPPYYGEVKYRLLETISHFGEEHLQHINPLQLMHAALIWRGHRGRTIVNFLENDPQHLDDAWVLGLVISRERLLPNLHIPLDKPLMRAAFSPLGDKLAYSTISNTYVLELASQKLTEIPGDAILLAWSPDSTSLAYYTSQGKLFTWTAKGGVEEHHAPQVQFLGWLDKETLVFRQGASTLSYHVGSKSLPSPLSGPGRPILLPKGGLAWCTIDNTTLTWQRGTTTRQYTIPAEMTVAAVLPDESGLLLTQQDSTMGEGTHILQLASGQLLSTGRKRFAPMHGASLHNRLVGFAALDWSDFPSTREALFTIDAQGQMFFTGLILGEGQSLVAAQGHLAAVYTGDELLLYKIPR